MSKEAMLTMKLEPELADVFMAEADACSDRPASQVVRELMCEFIERRRQAREYDTFQRQVDTARAQIASGQYAGDAEVEPHISRRRHCHRQQRLFARPVPHSLPSSS
jgi:hypothetical protein